MYSPQLKSQAIIFVISSPSGVGKSSLASNLLTGDANLHRPISVTTRTSRDGEINHKDYHFVSPEVFEQMVKNDEFIEHAQVLGNRYGITKAEIAHGLASSIDILLTIDWQGMLRLRSLFADKLSTIYLLPPSIEELRQRFSKRGDSTDIVNYRISELSNELQHHYQYDYLVVNDVFEQALSDLRHIIAAERRRQRHQNLASAFIASINNQL